MTSTTSTFERTFTEIKFQYKELDALREFVVPGSNREGLVKVHSSFSVDHVFDKLQKKDLVLWSQTWHISPQSHFERLALALQRGAKCRILCLKSDSSSLMHRSAELSLHSPRYDLPAAQQQAAMFIDAAKSLEKECREKRWLGSLSVQDTEYLASPPFLVVVRRGRPVSGFTGFYLSQPCTGNVFLEWTVPETVGATPKIAEQLCQYFTGKWNTDISYEAVEAFENAIAKKKSRTVTLSVEASRSSNEPSQNKNL